MKQSKWQEIVKHNRFTKGLQICNFALPFEIHWPLKKYSKLSFIHSHWRSFLQTLSGFSVLVDICAFDCSIKKTRTINLNILFSELVSILSSSHFNFEIPKFTSLLVLKKLVGNSNIWSPKTMVSKECPVNNIEQYKGGWKKPSWNSVN